MDETVKFDAAAQAAKQVRSAIAGLVEKRQELEASRDELQARIKELRELPLSRADLKKTIFDFIDTQGHAHLHRGSLHAAVAAFAFPRGGGRNRIPPFKGQEAFNLAQRTAPLCLADLDQLAGLPHDLASRVVADDAVSLYSVGRETFAHACFFFGQIMKDRIEENFDALVPGDYAFDEVLGAASSEEDRRREIDSSQAKVTGLSVEIEKIGQQLRELRAD